MYYIYVVKCSDESLYTGTAKNLYARIACHYYKKPQCAKYTKSHQVTSLEGAWQTENKGDALKLECFIKKLDKSHKLKLIQNPDLLKTKYGESFLNGGREYIHINVNLEECIEKNSKAET